MSWLIFTLRSGRQWPSAFTKQIFRYLSADIRAGSMVRYIFISLGCTKGVLAIFSAVGKTLTSVEDQINQSETCAVDRMRPKHNTRLNA